MATPPPATNASESHQDKLKQEGNALVQKQQFEQAASIYTLSLEADSTSDESSATIFSNRSLCFLNTNKFNEALQDAEKAISLRPAWHRGYQRAAAACEKLEKHEEGLKHLEKCFELDDATRNDSALKKMKESFEVNIIKQKSPSMTQEELKDAGNNFFKDEQYESAITIYTLAIEKDAFCDEAAPILSNRSLCYYNLKKYKEAYEDAGCCCGIRPDWAKGFMRRGVAAEKLGDLEIALESYDEYLKLDQSDEMDIETCRASVKESVDQAAREEKEFQDRLVTMDEMLSQLDESEEKLNTTMSTAFTLLFGGCTGGRIEAIELAVKHGADLGMPFMAENGPNRSPDEVTIAKQRLAKNAETPMVSCCAQRALMTLARFPSDSKISDYDTTRFLIKQREFLDRLFDLVDKQRKKYVRCSFMFMELSYVCSFDNNRPIRNDLVLILLEKGKKFFLNENESDRDWRRVLLSVVLMAGIFSQTTPEEVLRLRKQNKIGPDFLSRLSAAATPAVDRSIYECVQLLLEGLTAHDLNHIPQCISAVESDASGYLRSLPLQAAVVLGHRPPILQLLVDSGASADEQALYNNRNADEPIAIAHILQRSFMQNNPENARILLKNGARLEVEDVPKWAIDAIREEEKNFPDVPMMSISKKQCAIFMSMLPDDGQLQPTPSSFNSYFSQQLTSTYNFIVSAAAFSEETIRLVFDALSDQNVSAYSLGGNTCQTPFGSAIFYRLPLKFLRTLLKVRPKLIHSPACRLVGEDESRFPRYDQKTKKAGSDDEKPLVRIMYPFGLLVMQCVIASKNVSLEWVLDVAKLLFEGGLHYYTSVAERREPLVFSQLLLNMSYSTLENTTAQEKLDEMLEQVYAQNLVSTEPHVAHLLKGLQKFCRDYERNRKGKN